MSERSKSAGSLGGLARIWIRVAITGCALLVLVAFFQAEIAGAFGAGTGESTFIYLPCSLVISAVLFITALEFSRRDPTLDLTVAAEVLIAFGIFSMFVGLLFALLRVFQSEGSLELAGQGGLWSLVQPFVESVAAAGVGPILATALRFQDSARTGAEAPAAEKPAAPEAPAPEMGGETGAQFAAAAQNVFTQLEAVAGGLRGVADELERQKTAIASGVGGLSKEIHQQEAAVTSAVTAMKSSVERFAGALTGGGATLEESAKSSAEHLRELSSALEATKTTAGALKGELGELGGSSQRSRALMDALSEFISSLENFDLARK